ncbi:hypothetical protein G4Y79_16735 [Phototrophicus methaneseepsis]|uniref:Dockerin domain-containing protein n=1 Tax=Phototrophicus methaneseepsis TaxID=2710758 RepID=A0A7S8E6P4_9CHLR|nr:dockerin type I domain-containing protein [Phototrophicus methaneseepsis]QPC81335.1 hypothetical protein G4Y79_16735 [Phototrophicus methaneseepsis]
MEKSNWKSRSWKIFAIVIIACTHFVLANQTTPEAPIDPATVVEPTQAVGSAPVEQPIQPTLPPPTQIPPTQVPPTQIPPTVVPPTQVPPTEVPPTEIPPTQVLPTQVPPTEVLPVEASPTQPVVIEPSPTQGLPVEQPTQIIEASPTAISEIVATSVVDSAIEFTPTQVVIEITATPEVVVTMPEASPTVTVDVVLPQPTQQVVEVVPSPTMVFDPTSIPTENTSQATEIALLPPEITPTVISGLGIIKSDERPADTSTGLSSPILDPTATAVLPKSNVSGQVHLLRQDVPVTVAIAGDAFVEVMTIVGDDAFSIDLEPGLYEVRVNAAHYAARVMQIDVDTESVVLPTISLTGGDVNDDERVDMADIGLVSSYLGIRVPDAPSFADLNNDGIVNINDLVLVSMNLGKDS